MSSTTYKSPKKFCIAAFPSKGQSLFPKGHLKCNQRHFSAILGDRWTTTDFKDLHLPSFVNIGLKWSFCFLVILSTSPWLFDLDFLLSLMSSISRFAIEMCFQLVLWFTGIFTVWGISYFKILKVVLRIFSFCCHYKPFLRLTFVPEF